MTKNEVAQKVNYYYNFQGEDKIQKEDVVEVGENEYQVGDLIVCFKNGEIVKTSPNY